MSLTEIFNDALKYPFSDMTKFCILGVIMVISSLGSLELGNEIISSVLGLIGVIASLITLGYGVSVVKNAIIKSVIIHKPPKQFFISVPIWNTSALTNQAVSSWYNIEMMVHFTLFISFLMAERAATQGVYNSTNTINE